MAIPWVHIFLLHLLKAETMGFETMVLQRIDAASGAIETLKVKMSRRRFVLMSISKSQARKSYHNSVSGRPSSTRIQIKVG